MRRVCTLCSAMKSHIGASCSLSDSGRCVNPSQSSSRWPARLACLSCASAASLTARRMFSRSVPSSMRTYAFSSASCSTTSASSLEPVATWAMR